MPGEHSTLSPSEILSDNNLFRITSFRFSLQILGSQLLLYHCKCIRTNILKAAA
nr:hypothetical protein Iba_chr15aCG2430 [Ipomoea batatas]